jgi:hypothetical protein
MAKKYAILPHITVHNMRQNRQFGKKKVRDWLLRKTPIFSQKIGKSAENSDHKNGPR